MGGVMLSGYTLGIVPGTHGYAAALGAGSGMLLLASARRWHPHKVWWSPGMAAFLDEAERRLGPCIEAHLRSTDGPRSRASYWTETRNRQAIVTLLSARGIPMVWTVWGGLAQGQEAAAAEALERFPGRGEKPGTVAWPSNWRAQLAAVLADRSMDAIAAGFPARGRAA